MVGYGHSLTEAKRPGWDNLDYASLKILLKEYSHLLEKIADRQSHNSGTSRGLKSPTKTSDNASNTVGERKTQSKPQPEESSNENSALLLESGLRNSYLSSDGVDVDDNIVDDANVQPYPKIEEDFLSIEELEDEAYELSEKFLQELRTEVERISLFTLSRQGELSDATGSLRFPYLRGAKYSTATLGHDPNLSKDVADEYTPDDLSSINNASDNFTQQQHEGEEEFYINYEHDESDITKSENGLSYRSEDSGHGLSYDGTEDAFSIDDDVDFGFIDDLYFLLPRMVNQGDSTINIRETRIDDACSPKPMFTGVAVLGTKDRDGLEIKNEESALNSYTFIAVELLHLLRYICVNAMGVRKILKKYEKVLKKYERIISPDKKHSSARHDSLRNEVDKMHPFVSSFSIDSEKGAELHLQILTNLDAIAAITSSLLKASMSTGAMDAASIERFLIHDESLLRFKCAVDCIDILREYASVVNEPFPSFLSRKAMTVTGYDLGGIAGMKQKALEVLLSFEPDLILRMGKLDLAEWQQRCWNYTFTDDGEKMRPTSFDFLREEVTDRPQVGWGGVSNKAMFINLASIFLYTVNYYIVAPTANLYALHLGIDEAFGSVLIGVSSASALVAAFMYSFWYSQFSFKSALIFSSLTPVFGNLMYALALTTKSLKLAIAGRMLVGLGSAEVINRQLISTCVHFNHMTSASVAFVVAGALGMSVGPLVTGLMEIQLDFFVGRGFSVYYELPYIGGVIIDHLSIPVFFMAAMWFFELVLLIFFFREPSRINSVFDKGDKKKMTFAAELKLIFNLIFRKPALPATLFLFGFIEMVYEVLISSCSMISRQYFGWSASNVGFLVAALTACVLPVQFIVERASRSFSDRFMTKCSLVFIAVSLFGVINYETMLYDAEVIGIDARDTSVAAWNTTINDWQILRDPVTWENLHNESEVELFRLRNATDKEWQEATHQWLHFVNVTENELEAFSEDMKTSYLDKINSTAEKYEELSKKTQTGLSHVLNESKVELSRLKSAASKELTNLPNQTSDEWKKVSSEVQNEWIRLPNQTQEEWDHLKSETTTEWGQIKKSTSGDEWKKLPNQTQEEWDHLKSETTTKWGEIKNSTPGKVNDLRDTTSAKWTEFSSASSDVVDNAQNASLNVWQSTKEQVSHAWRKRGNTRRLQGSDEVLAYDWNYGNYAYVIGIFSVFIWTIVLEGVDTGLMCKAAPSKLNSTFINVGLLATLVGTMGRIFGDGLILSSALIGRNIYMDLVNTIFLPLIP
eukprot:CAMPEP_0194105894 /NCGR_PEP_ID=MMETSP0150-20130528/6008_1 /TAXON_ID=122233 /ORGANISM="Chaetoceros debilis, Strain MM31A-1" /LENGTH=1264 /DNA_ID=CAMNT_0038793885 /DNA_START=23 /DNA_END=3814 /DNA_ORIENTATION=+